MYPLLQYYNNNNITICLHADIIILAGLPGFDRDHCSIIIYISAIYFFLNYFKLFYLEIVAFPRLLMKC